MRIRVLGAAGGELPGQGSTSFLVDGRLAVDAGALTSRLGLEELDRVDDVLVTHAHLDHVKDVPQLADLMVGRRKGPVTVHASRAAASTLRRCVFNGELWPDFTRIPGPRSPVLRIAPFRYGTPFTAGPFEVAAVRMAHSVETAGFVVRRGRTAFAISGDTGPTEAFWRVAGRTRGLRALLVEVSFPSRMQRLADHTGHLTPRTLAGELAKLERDRVPVYLYHLKPAFRAELRAELAALGLRDATVLDGGETITA